MPSTLNTLALAHRFLQEQVKPGAFCIDATAGRGRDTAFLCSLVGPQGRVLAFDIQQAAVDSTRALLEEKGYSSIAQVVLDSHSHMARYAEPQTVDCVVFNLGWLPGGDHTVFTTADTTIPAVEAALELLRPGGVCCLCIYYGGASGTQERDALLPFLESLDSDRYTVIVSRFANRPGDQPIPVFLYKDA